MATATIKLFLAQGDPKRLRTAELSNWNGKAVAGPRSEFDDLLKREEAVNAGTYILAGTDPETGSPAIYIGEAESIKDRIRAHLAKDFWNQVVFFISKDENLTKSHIRYLEGRLIEQATEAKRAIVKNNQASGSKLPESDREDMEVFLSKILQLLPVLGIEHFVLAAKPKADSHAAQAMLYCAIKGVQAKGYVVPNGFLVLAGSQAVEKERASVERWPWPKNMRDDLLNRGVLTHRNGYLEFLQDAEFSSPSAAAAVIHGGHANGLTAWKDIQGKALKDIESR